MTNDLLPLTKQRNDLFRYSRMDVSIITVKIEMLTEKNHCIASQKAVSNVTISILLLTEKITVKMGVITGH